MFKKVVAVWLVFGFLFISCVTDAGVVSADQPAAKMTLEQLRIKFPAGKYWNHANAPGADNQYNNQDGYTEIPCSNHSGTIGTENQTCNAFLPGSMQLSWQCMGFAEKLAYDFTGFNPRNNANGWQTHTSVSALDTIKPGDIVRYKTHSIFVTAVNGDTVTYADCNSDGHCIIKWGRTVSKATLAASFVHVRSAPFAVPSGLNTLTVSYHANGGVIPGSDAVTVQYRVVDSTGINLRSGPGTEYGRLTALPVGTVFTVTEEKAGGNYTWGKTTYAGQTGWCVISEDWTEKFTLRVTDYYIASNGIIQNSSTNQAYTSGWVCGTAYADGPAAPDLFGIEKTGYRFAGWSTLPQGGTVFQSGVSVRPEDICPEVKNGSCTITLYAVWERTAVLSRIEIVTKPRKLHYLIGQSLDTAGLSIKLIYDNGESRTVSDGFTVSGFDSLTLGTKTLTVAYEGKTAGFAVSVCEFLPGDANNDRKVDLDDVVLLAQYAAQWDVECNVAVMDVTADGTVDLRDVVLLAQYTAEWDGIELG